ncbi:hypothetical protein ACOSP6_13095 [Tenacibaculum sp. MEBiC06402]|uniref:hypothetical protein n=1 Tax=unclassified Tenacibaculum TaxID=2635139 RepID=UPI003B9B35B3
MKNTHIILLILMISSFSIYSQRNTKTPKLGQVKDAELKMGYYDKDSTAGALVLEEKGYSYVDDKNNYDFRRDIYRRIKIFNKSEFNRTTIEVDLYQKEQIKYIEAVTYNLEDGKRTKIFLLDKQIFKKQPYENWTQVSFTLPNIKEGSVIEYRYSIFSPYSQIDDWKFQWNIPKLKSDFISSFPGNWKYNIRIRSAQKLDRNKSYIKRDCISIGGLGQGDCSVMEYGMDNIPAFKKEDFMVSEENFKAKLIFEPISFTQTNGVVTRYTKTWKDADETMRKNFLDAQTSKKGYFRKKLPQNLFSITSESERAEAIYNHIQEKLSWNKKFRTKTIRVKEIYQKNTGGVDGINLVLYNALQAAGIESYVVALSTRNNGILTKLHPSIKKFNYYLVKVITDGKTHFLDATDKNFIFGEFPFECLNGEVRVFDFKKGSYWELLKPNYRSSIRNNISLKFNEDGEMVGDIITTDKGYNALIKRKALKVKSEEEFLEEFETENPLIEVEEFEVISDKKDVFKTSYNISIPDFTLENSNIKLNPFIIERTTKNPFKLKERNYPVDFGYAWSESFSIRVAIPDGYTISKVPENKALSLPGKGGKLIYRINKTDKEVIIFMKYSLNRAIYTNIEYHYLKEYFKNIIKVQDSYIELKKA